MKVFLSNILFLILCSTCTVSKKTANSTPHLVGEITVRQIQESEHKDWFNKELNTYPVDTETLDDFLNNPKRLKQISVTIFLGTWCSDSQREFPRFYNIMRYLNITNYTIIGMDLNKKTPKKLEKGMDIKYVPTIIIYQNGKEINRIIESPIQSLEKDLIAIVQTKNYTPKYN